MNFLRGVRNNWKKSFVATGLLAYGANEAKLKYEINNYMRECCSSAVKYGDEIHPIMNPQKKILVILNPAANHKKAEKTFKTYCGPVLHLGGCIIDIILTDHEGHAKNYVEELEQLPSSILVAGGSGTLSEVVTGLMRRPNGDKCPVGILPIGRCNIAASKFFDSKINPNKFEAIQNVTKTALAVLKGQTQKIDIMEVQPLSTEDEIEQKPLFALSGLQWGGYRDAKSIQDKYWYFGPLRNYASVLFNAFSSKLTWKCNAILTYSPPCTGCKNCYVPKEANKSQGTKRWWSNFGKKFNQVNLAEIDYSKITNDMCNSDQTSQIESSEVILFPLKDEAGNSKLVTKLENQPKSGFNFITHSWKRINSSMENDINSENIVESRVITIEPIDTRSDQLFYIDNEEYDVRPIKISLLKEAIDVFKI